jgi:hypothetical protein
METRESAGLREERREQLMEMWRDRRGQSTVLRLFHGALPKGEVARAGMSVFDVILQSEFGEVPRDDDHGGSVTHNDDNVVP